jgi:hypothetical protein
MELTAISKKAVWAAALIVSLSFALGYLWGHGSSAAPIVIEKCSDA